MSCNGCRVLRRGCGRSCLLRQCLQGIETDQAQANATQFAAKYFGRSNLLSKIQSVPEEQRSALFESLLFEACGRTVNPVGGAIGLLTTGNWHLCQRAVSIVLAGGSLEISIPEKSMNYSILTNDYFFESTKDRQSPGEVDSPATSFIANEIMNYETFSNNVGENKSFDQPKLLNLFF